VAESEIVMRVHRVRAEVVVAACDAELVGRDLPVGNHGHTVKVSAHFYGERRVAPEELLWALQRATVANLLGERVCAMAEQAGFLRPEGKGQLGGVPHAEIITVLE
jgi:uncharacterized protein